MEKPTKAKWDREQHLTRLFFEGRQEEDRYYVTGAIEWAIGLIPGYAVLSAQHVKTGVLWIFEEFPFWTVQTVGMEKPLWEFFRTAWKKYLCRYFYYSNPKDHSRFLRQVYQEPLIRSHPVFVEAEYASKAHDRLDNLILEYQRQGKIKIDKEAGDREIIGNLYDQLSEKHKGLVLDEDTIPGIKALRCLLAGITKHPYQKPMMTDEEIPKSYV